MDSLLPPPPPPQEPYRNWVELPRDITASILRRLGSIEILNTARYVCSTWRSICKDPSMWRTIDMHNLGDLWDMDYDLDKLCRVAVDWSCGGLLDINIEYFCNDDLLIYIADRSSHLKRLRLVACHDVSEEGFAEATAKFPLLEELDITHCSLSGKAFDVVGLNCPLLRSLKLNSHVSKVPRIECNEEALAIAEKLPCLRHLQVVGNKLTNEGLHAILDGCPHLVSLDLRCCFNICLDGNLGKRCAEQIKDLRRPHDSTDDCPFDTQYHVGSSDEDYPFGFSDIDILTDGDDNDIYEFSSESYYSDYYDQGNYYDPGNYYDYDEGNYFD